MNNEWQEAFPCHPTREEALEDLAKLAAVLAAAWSPESLAREKLGAAWLLLREVHLGEMEGGAE